MTLLPLKLRKKVVAACNMHEGARAEIAGRFGVSLAMVKELLGQCLIPAHGAALRELVTREPDLTLTQIRARLGMDCTIQAVHQVLGSLGLRQPKRPHTLSFFLQS